MKRTLAAVFAVLLVLFALTGCSNGSSYREDYPSDAEAYYNRDGMNAPLPADSVSSNTPDELDPLGNRKVIRNASLTVETLEFEEFLTAVIAKTNELGGYVESNVVSNYAPYYSRAVLRNAKLTLRVPADKLDDLILTVDGAGNITSREEKVSDITDTYIDVEAKLSALRTEYDTLLALLEKADNLDDIIRIQDRLSNVRYEIESYEARMRSYDSLIAFSTVKLEVNEVERETAVVEETFGQEVSRRFKESLEDVGGGFRDFAAWFIGNLPAIVVVLFFFPGVPLIIVFIVLACVKKAKKKRAAEKTDRSES